MDDAASELITTKRIGAPSERVATELMIINRQSKARSLTEFKKRHLFQQNWMLLSPMTRRP